MQATITEISDATEVDLRRGRDENVLDLLKANPKVGRFSLCAPHDRVVPPDRCMSGTHASVSPILCDFMKAT